MDKKLLDALNNLSFALEAISNILSTKGDKKSDTAKALSSGDISKKIDEMTKSLSRSLEEGLKKSKTTTKDTSISQFLKKISSIEVSVNKVLKSTQQLVSLQKSISETRPEITIPKEILKIPTPNPLIIPLRYGKLEPLILPIPKPIILTFSKLKMPEIPKFKNINIGFEWLKFPPLPSFPKVPKVTIDFIISKIPKLPNISKSTKITIDFLVSKMPKLPSLPKLPKINIDFLVNKLPKLPSLPKLPKLNVDFLVSKMPKLPNLPKLPKINIDFLVSKMPKLPSLPKLPKINIDFLVSKLPSLPKLPKLNVDFLVSKMPKLPSLPKLPKINIDFLVSKMPKLPSLPKLPKFNIDFLVSKMPKLPNLPKLPKINVDFLVSKMPKLPSLPKLPKLNVDFLVSKMPKLPSLPKLPKINLDFLVSKLPKLPSLPKLPKINIDFLVSKMPKLPSLPKLPKLNVDFLVSKMPKLPSLPKLPKINVDFLVSKMPKMPSLPKMPKIDLGFTLPKMPKMPSLPKMPKIDLGFTLPKMPKLPSLPKMPKIDLGFTVPKMPKMPSLPKMPNIGLSFSKPKLPVIPTPKPVEVEVKVKKPKTRTIEAQAKEKESGGLFGKVGDSKETKNIQSGIKLIILIAAGVLAIGLALKIVGGVNVASVLALGLAISVLTVAFAKLAEAKNLTPGRAVGLTAVLVGISLAVMLSSFILAAIKPVGLIQMFTAIMIAGMFTVLSYGIGKLLIGVSKITGKGLLMLPLLPFIMVGISLAIAASSLILGMVKPVGLFQMITSIMIAGMFAVVSYGLGQLLTGLGKLNTKSIAFIPLLPLILIAISAAILGSSYLLAGVKPIGLFQAITAIFIAGVFAVVGFGLGKLLKGFEGISGAKAVVIAAILPILMIAISAAILGSSFLLAGVKPIGLFQALTAVMIGIIFIPISFAIPFITKGIQNVNVGKIALVPIVMVAMALTIMLSSYLLAEVKVVPFAKLMSALGISVVLGVIGLGMGEVFNRLSKFTKKTMVDGGINMAIIAAAVVASSLILSVGKYDKYPSIGWIFHAGIAMLGFGYAILTLNKLGLKPSDVIKGGISVVAIATTIYLTSLILSKGTYDKYPSLTWDFYTAVAMVGFGYAIFLLNKIGLSTADVIKGGISVIAIAGTIMATSHILAKGDYSITPPIEWVMKSAVGLVVFGTAIYVINKFAKPTDILKGAISVLLISGTIMAASHILALGDYSKTPSLDWTINTAAAMIPFGIAAVVLGTIATSGVGAVAIAAGLVAILAVAGAIVATDKILAVGDYSKYPSIDWSKTVGLTLGAFAVGMGALGAIIVGSLGLGAVALAAGAAAVLGIAETVVKTSEILSKGKYTSGPTVDWASGVALSLSTFSDIYRMMVGNSVMSFFTGGGKDDFKNSIMMVADTLVTASNKLATGNFTKGPTKEWALGVAIALSSFGNIYKMLVANKVMSLFGGGGIGPKEFSESITMITDSISLAATKLGKVNFKGGPTETWAKGVSLSLGAFGDIYRILVQGRIMDALGVSGVSPKAFSDAITTITSGIVISANTFALFKSSFKEGPKKEWAEGVSIALEAFSPLYKYLVSEKIMNYLGIGGVSIESFKSAIVTISQGITESAKIFANPENQVDWKTGPTKEWAEGVSIALSAFSPIYKYLVTQKIMDYIGIGGVSDESYKSAIVTIAKGITEAAREFAKPENQVAYKNGPTKTWAEGVSLALGAFTGIFQALGANSSWFTGTLKPSDYQNAIKAIGTGLAEAAKAIGGEGVVYDINKVPDKVWGEKISGSFMAFIPALKYISDQSGWFSNGAKDTVTNMAAISTAIKDASLTLALGNYTTIIDSKWTSGIKATINGFLDILKKMSEQDFDYDDEYDHLKSSANVLVSVSRILSVGKYVEIPKTYLSSLKSNMTTFVNLLTLIGKSDIDNDKLEQVKELSTSIKGVSLILALGNYNKVIPKAWMDSVRTNLMSFSQMIRSFDSGGFLSMFSDSTSEKVTELANGIIELAKIFNENKVPFDVKKVPSLQWSQGFSTALAAIMPGLNYISQNDGLLTSGEDKFKSGVNAIVDSIVSISLKLSKGKFDKALNVNFFKSLSDSTQSYINMTKSLESADLNYESVSDMADSMVELAKAYDRLSEAMTNLNGQLGSVDMERMTMLKNLSGSIVMLSLMDSTQFEKMMTSLESKAKIFVDLMKDTEKSATAGMEKTASKPVEVKAGTKAATPSTVKTPQQTQKQSAEDAMSKLASAISGLQGQVAVIANVIGGGGGNTSLQEYMETRMKKNKTGLSE